MAKTGSVAIQMAEILDDYSKEVKTATNNAIEKTSKESVQKLKNTSPRGTPHRRRYAESWTLKKERERNGIATVTVHNKQYQLTHLLENGHVIRNEKGEYGRYNGVKHIAPVEDWAKDALPEEIERELE
jgi:hypothetical protein